MSEDRPRISWIDVTKGLAIILVVYGHVMQGLVAAGVLKSLEFFRFSDSFVYSFHIPAFFLVSGLFVRQGVSRGAKQFIKDKLATIAWPYLVWSVVAVVCAIFFRKYYNHPESLEPRLLLYILWQPIGLGWFLYVLFLMHMSTIVFCRISPWIVLVCSAALRLFLPKMGILVIDEFFFYLPFFAAGQCATPYLEQLARLSPGRLTVAVLILGAVQVGAIALGAGRIPTLYFLLGFSGTLMLILASLSLREAIGYRLMQQIGVASLAVYLVHPYFHGLVRAILLKGFDISLPLAHILLQTSLAVLGPVVLWRLSLALGLHSIFTLKKPRSG